MRIMILSAVVGLSFLTATGCATNINKSASFSEVLAKNKNGRLWAKFYFIDGKEAEFDNRNFHKKTRIGNKYCADKGGTYEQIKPDGKIWGFPFKDVASKAFGTFKCTLPTGESWFVVNEIREVKRLPSDPPHLQVHDVFFRISMKTQSEIEQDERNRNDIARERMRAAELDLALRRSEEEARINAVRRQHERFKASISAQSIGREVCRDSDLTYQVYLNSSVLGHNFNTVSEPGGVVAAIDGYSPDKERIKVMVSNFFTYNGRLKYAPHGNVHAGDIVIVPGAIVWVSSVGWRFC